MQSLRFHVDSEMITSAEAGLWAIYCLEGVATSFTTIGWRRVDFWLLSRIQASTIVLYVVITENARPSSCLVVDGVLRRASDFNRPFRTTSFTE